MILEETHPAAIPNLIDGQGRRVMLDDARIDGDLETGKLWVRPTYAGGGYVSEDDFTTLDWHAADDYTRGAYGDW